MLFAKSQGALQDNAGGYIINIFMQKEAKVTIGSLVPYIADGAPGGAQGFIQLNYKNAVYFQDGPPKNKDSYPQVGVIN
jgi:hypothetical protein